MKDKWKENLGLKIMATFIAIILWWFVVNIDDPLMTQKYKVEVKLAHTEVVTNVGKSYQIEDNLKTVTVTVKARRKVVAKLQAVDIAATADFREMQDNSVPIRITIPKYEGNYVEASANPRNLQVNTEDTMKKTFTISTRTIGEIQEGYVLGTLTAKPQTIDISGPKSLVGRISKVVARVHVSELSETTDLKAELIYYDSADNMIDQTQLSSNCDRNGVEVNVQVLETKKIKVELETAKIQAARGYVFKGASVEPNYIEVCGIPDVLNQLSAITVPASALNLKNLKENKEVVLDLTEYLPEQVAFADQEKNSVVVSIVVEKEGTKTILLPVRSIVIENSPKDLQMNYGPEQEIKLEFSGLDENIERLNAESITALIDLSGFDQPGTYDVPVKISKMPDGCTYIGNVTVQIILEE